MLDFSGHAYLAHHILMQYEKGTDKTQHCAITEFKAVGT